MNLDGASIKKSISTKQKATHIRQILTEIVNGGHMPALDTSALAFTTALLLGFTPTFDLLLAAYLFTYGSYSLNRKRESTQDMLSSPDRTRYLLRREKYVNSIIFSCYLGAMLIALLRSTIFFAALFVPLTLSYLYNVGSRRFIPIIGASRLKEKFLVKNTAVSAGWGLVAFLILIYYEGMVTSTVLAVYTLIFLRIFINTVFCDMRDVKSDSAAGILTIPILIGAYRTKIILVVLNTFSGLFVLVATAVGLLPPIAYFINIITLYGYYYILRSFRTNANMVYLSDFVAEGEEIVSVPLVILGKMIL